MLQESSDGLALEALADQFGVSKKTIQRDLKKLQKSELLTFQVSRKAHGRKLWQIDESPHTSSAFKFDEAAAFSLGCRFLAPLKNTDLGEAAKEGLQKIRKQLGQLGTYQICLFSRLLEVFYESTTGWCDYSKQSEIITTLTMACENERETVIRYRSYAAEEEQCYTIHPYALIIQMGTLYVLGFSCKNDEMRTWKLNRISTAECLKTKFNKLKNFDLDTHRRKGFGVFVFSNKPVEKVRIKVDGVMARYVQEHNWHETQYIEEQPDGSVIVQFEVVPTQELTNWIMQLGCNAEVLEPESLRQRIASEIAKMNQRYTTTKSTKKQ